MRSRISSFKSGPGIDEISQVYNFFFFFSFVFSRADPSAYGGSQARGLIGAVATGLHQSHSWTALLVRVFSSPLELHSHTIFPGYFQY